MLQQIVGGSSLRGYDSSTCDGVKTSDVVAKKLASLFHIHSKSHTVHLNKKHFHAGKALGLINITNFSVSIPHFTIVTILIIKIYCNNSLFVFLLSEFWLGITSSYYVNVQSLGNGNICSDVCLTLTASTSDFLQKKKNIEIQSTYL